MLTLPQLTCVFVCVCTSECVSLQPYLQISLMRNYWGAALIFFFFATDNLFFKVTTYICLYFKTASCSTDEMKFHSKWKFIFHPICALLSLVFTRLVLKWLWPAGVYKASLACERHRSHWKRGAIGKKLVPERRGRKEWKRNSQVGRGEDDGKMKRKLWLFNRIWIKYRFEGSSRTIPWFWHNLPHTKHLQNVVSPENKMYVDIQTCRPAHLYVCMCVCMVGVACRPLDFCVRADVVERAKWLTCW